MDFKGFDGEIVSYSPQVSASILKDFQAPEKKACAGRLRRLDLVDILDLTMGLVSPNLPFLRPAQVSWVMAELHSLREWVKSLGEPVEDRLGKWSWSINEWLLDDYLRHVETGDFSRVSRIIFSIQTAHFLLYGEQYLAYDYVKNIEVGDPWSVPYQGVIRRLDGQCCFEFMNFSEESVRFLSSRNFKSKMTAKHFKSYSGFFRIPAGERLVNRSSQNKEVLEPGSVHFFEVHRFYGSEAWGGDNIGFGSYVPASSFHDRCSATYDVRLPVYFFTEGANGNPACGDIPLDWVTHVCLGRRSEDAVNRAREVVYHSVDQTSEHPGLKDLLDAFRNTEKIENPSARKGWDFY